jgi:putative N6-adenine-specific DNA methylase
LAVCAPGIEELCRSELAALNVSVRRTLRGGVEFSATDRQLYAANLWCRTANRIVVRVARFTATTFADLQQHTKEVDWSGWLADGTAPIVRASSTGSRLSHTDAIAERITTVVQRGDENGLLVVARIMHDRVTLSVDSSGAPLYQRGWRGEQAKAPLRETLAAALVLASGWDRTSPLVDPFCGSGTIAIEAARIAQNVPPASGRHYAFETWPSFAPGTWASVKAVPPPQVAPPILAADRDAGAVEATGANAGRAGVNVETRHAAISALEPPPGPGWLISNPPYGRRVGGGDLRDLFASFGQVVRQRWRGWSGTLLSADPRVAGHSGLRFEERFRSSNGGIPVHALSFTN